MGDDSGHWEERIRELERRIDELADLIRNGADRFLEEDLKARGMT